MEEYLIGGFLIESSREEEIGDLTKKCNPN